MSLMCLMYLLHSVRDSGTVLWNALKGDTRWVRATDQCNVMNHSRSLADWANTWNWVHFFIVCQSWDWCGNDMAHAKLLLLKIVHLNVFKCLRARACAVNGNRLLTKLGHVLSWLYERPFVHEVLPLPMAQSCNPGRVARLYAFVTMLSVQQ